MKRKGWLIGPSVNCEDNAIPLYDWNVSMIGRRANQLALPTKMFSFIEI